MLREFAPLIRELPPLFRDKVRDGGVELARLHMLLLMLGETVLGPLVGGGGGVWLK